MTTEQLIEHFVATGEHNEPDAAWPGRSFCERACAAARMLRAALIAKVRETTGGHELPSLPVDFDARQFVLAKVGPMVSGLFPGKERALVLEMLENSVVFVTQDNIERLLSEIQHLHSAWQVANLYLGSLGLPGLDAKRVAFVGFSEETTFYLSMAYFGDADPFADWVVHEAAHVFHNWKREFAGLPSTRSREFLLPIDYRKRELFAYACEAYATILESAGSPADRRRLHAEYAANWAPSADGMDRDELIAAVAEAVDARNGWKRILRHSMQPEEGARCHKIVSSVSSAGIAVST
jgi:hypothetical protein